jgi:cytidylate kinase
MINVIPDTLAEKIISGKIKEWENKRKMEKEAVKRKPNPFLTISRDFGCGEERIIPALEKEFGWHVYGKDLLNFVVEKEGLNRAVLETLDEKRQADVFDWVNYIMSSGSIPQKDYVVKVSHLIKTIVLQESAIILGRGGNYILRGKPEGLRIKITAPFDDRVDNISQLRKLALQDAKNLVSQMDKERKDFIDSYFHGNDQGFEDFDLVINTKSFSDNSICKMTRIALEEKTSHST